MPLRRPLRVPRDLQLFPIVFVGLLPRNKAEQLEMQKSSDSSVLGGKIFVVVAAGSILFSILQAAYELIFDV